MPSWFRVAGWIMTIGALAVYAIMGTVTLPHLMSLTAGEPIFDLRLGYDLDAARKVLRLLGEEGRGYYAVPQHMLDSLFPPLVALALAYWLVRAGTRWRRSGLPMPAIALGMLAGLPFLAAAFDLAENAMVSQMLALGPEGVTESLVGAASAMTVTKWIAFSATFAVLVVLVLGPFAARGPRSAGP